MPNHVQSRLKILGTQEQVNEVLEKFSSWENNKRHFPCFNKIIPRPASLNITSGSLGSTGYAVITGECPDRISLGAQHYKDSFEKMDLEKRIQAIELGLQYVKNEQEHGHVTWYNWSIANWGTKWNSYNNEQTGDNVFEFETAWSGVPDLICEMSKEFPGIKFLYDFADEDTGANCGSFIFDNGDTVGGRFTNGSKKAYELAFDLRPGDREYYELVNGEYQHIEHD